MSLPGLEDYVNEAPDRNPEGGGGFCCPSQKNIDPRIVQRREKAAADEKFRKEEKKKLEKMKKEKAAKKKVDEKKKLPVDPVDKKKVQNGVLTDPRPQTGRALNITNDLETVDMRDIREMREDYN